MQMFYVSQKMWKLELFFKEHAGLQKYPFMETTNFFYEENLPVSASRILPLTEFLCDLFWTILVLHKIHRFVQ